MKYLLILLLGLCSFWARGQSDIKIAEPADQIRPKASDQMRLYYIPSSKAIRLLKSDGTYVELATLRAPKVYFDVWPPEQIATPVLGDKAMGPTLPSDSTIQQVAEYNGVKWMYDVKRIGSPFP